MLIQMYCRTFAQIVHLGQGSCKEHAVKEEHIFHAVLQAQIRGVIEKFVSFSDTEKLTHFK